MFSHWPDYLLISQEDLDVGDPIMNKQKWAGKIIPDQFCFNPERFIVFDRWRSLKVGILLPGLFMCMGQGRECIFKTKNGILKGPSHQLFLVEPKENLFKEATTKRTSTYFEANRH